MLRRASVSDVENGRVVKGAAYLVVVMRYYPRFLRKERVDEYARDLAPPAELFSDFKAREKKVGTHNTAFYLVAYERRFDLSEKGRAKLAELVELSREREVVLICQCRDFDRCHADLLLLWAREKLAAEVGKLVFDYPEFLARLAAPGPA